MVDQNAPQPQKGWSLGAVFLFVILPLAAGIILSLIFIPQPVVGVIYFSDEIYSYTASDLISQINYARVNPEIKAVVIVMNSPGGTVVDTESVYLELARLRETKPVVTMIEGMAASGGYYLSVGTDYIFAKPSSLVGNIGIIGYLPSEPSVMEEIYSTGPYKMWGERRDDFIRQMEPLKQGFLQAVKLGRGEALNAPDELILSGQIWSGSQAFRMGLVDELGAQSRAFDKAAQLAKITHYRVEDLRTLVWKDDTANIYASAKILPEEPGLYYLYMPPVEVKP
jgi:protease-4